MALEPITRKEKIIAGQDLTPITRLEKFLKQFGGGGGGGSVPKPLTFDYMPEGYPSKSVQTTTLMEEQELAFALMQDPIYGATLQSPLEIVVSKTYAVKWDGNEYECVCVVSGNGPAFGNMSIIGSGDDTGEPFLYVYNTKLASGLFGTLDTSASHTISVKRIDETVTPMAEEFLPANKNNTTVFYRYMAQDEPTAPILRHADGTVVTAQEAYDAFMNTRVLIVADGTTYEAISMVWRDNNSAQDNPNDVVFVSFKYMFKGDDGIEKLVAINVIDSPSVPA